MKWESVDINVVEQANTVKFSKLDNIGAPLRLFELLFDNALVDMIVSYTNLFSHIEKTDTSLEMTKETFCLFLGMPLLSGFHKLPNRKMYCKANPDTCV